MGRVRRVPNADSLGDMLLCPAKTPDETALLCSQATYVTANADQTYMFADELHPTTRLHALFAQFVEQQIAGSGLGH
ncbi:phospholipase/lecithinase/hemolysin [Paraburkholderia sp. GAS448]